jgi:hypothetical protein
MVYPHQLTTIRHRSYCWWGASRFPGGGCVFRVVGSNSRGSMEELLARFWPGLLQGSVAGQGVPCPGCVLSSVRVCVNRRPEKGEGACCLGCNKKLRVQTAHRQQFRLRTLTLSHHVGIWTAGIGYQGDLCVRMDGVQGWGKCV